MVNHDLKKKYKGKIALMTGRQYDDSHHVTDGIHPGRDGKERMWEKLKLCIQCHENHRRQSLNK